MNEDWKDNGQSCTTYGADQRDEIIQLGNADRHDACNETLHKSPIVSKHKGDRTIETIFAAHFRVVFRVNDNSCHSDRIVHYFRSADTQRAFIQNPRI